jgi:predicted RNA-binding protein with PUA domain
LRGILDEAKIALQAFKKAIQIDPTNQESKENYENLALEVGVMDINEEDNGFKPK